VPVTLATVAGAEQGTTVGAMLPGAFNTDHMAGR
jgi:cytidine deaminase